jgi:NHLM bacteriocin system ABC transporter ATP-binding protein
MSLFQEAITARLLNDEELLKEVCADLSSAVIGRKTIYAAMRGDVKEAQYALGPILAYYRLPMIEPSKDIDSIYEQIDAMIRGSGLLKRRVRLTEGWYKQGIGPLLSERDGKPIALIPGFFTGYQYIDRDTGKTLRIHKQNVSQISPEAYCFYKPLPQRSIGIKELLCYMIHCLSLMDILFAVFISLGAIILGMISPALTHLLCAAVIPAKSLTALGSSVVLLLGASVSLYLITIAKNLLLHRIAAKVTIAVEAVFMGRILILPASFFKQYPSGALSERISGLSSLCSLLSGTVISLGLSILFSFVYLLQISIYTPPLFLPSLIISIVILLFGFLLIFCQSKRASDGMNHTAEMQGFLFELLNGIQKIKLVGAEIRGFAAWAKKYSVLAKYRFNPPLIIKIQAAVKTLMLLLSTISIYICAGRAEVRPENFIAFTLVYGMICGAVLSLYDMFHAFGSITSGLRFIAPVLETLPELCLEKQRVSRLSGMIELNNVSFRYNDTRSMLFDNLSLKIRKGEYVALVGRSGCGKSTLFRLLLGFETPRLGSVYYDGKDLNKLDLQSVRRHIGVVLQNGKLLHGSIYENIVLAAPHLSLDDAWEAAEIAGLADDIRAMPMGMFTMLLEGRGGFSGGQKQRLLLARAIVPKPPILLLDEATSALDNITQKRVSDALDKLKSTRLIIAHRLSTIRRCDRIMVLERGCIAEEGTYTDLLNQGGMFAELVARQRLDL